MKSALLIASVLLILFTSCDPLRRVQMRNHTTGPVEFILQLKEDSALHSPLFINNALMVHFKLLPEKPHHLANLSVGIGSWTHMDITDFADDLEAVIIIKDKDTTHITSSAAIASLLYGKRKGLTKSRIVLIP